MRRALERLAGPRPGVPVADLVRLGRDVRRSGGLTLDLAAARAIGVPVVVLRPAAPAARELLAKLSSRERQVALLIARGYRNEEIARELGISVATTKDHVHHVLTKADMASRTELAAALARGGV